MILGNKVRDTYKAFKASNQTTKSNKAGVSILESVFRFLITAILLLFATGLIETPLEAEDNKMILGAIIGYWLS